MVIKPVELRMKLISKIRTGIVLTRRYIRDPYCQWLATPDQCHLATDL